MKRLLATVLLAFSLLFIGSQDNQAEAREVFMGRYNDGTAVYLLSESLAGGGSNFTCTVRAGYDYLYYHFYYRNGSPYYSNNEGYQGYVFGGASPVAAAIWNYAH